MSLEFLQRLKNESVMNRLQIEDILVLTEEEETSPLFVSPRTVRRVEVNVQKGRENLGDNEYRFGY